MIFTAATAGILISSLAAGILARDSGKRSLILTGFVTTLCGITAMISLALVGVIGLVAALFLPANPVLEGVGGSPDEVR